ncbi:hypothetical protein KM043_005581 [Ampulex compressa]|nr:hypothetical protein KM043_005581 [Ampulex compressa]
MSLVIPKSPILTVRSSATMQFLAARSRCTNFFAARYAMPSAISMAICRILFRVGGSFVKSSQVSGLWLRRYLFRSPLTMSSMTTRVGCTFDTTPSSLTTWWVLNALQQPRRRETSAWKLRARKFLA